MSLSVRDVEDAVLEANAEAQDLIAEAVQEFYEPTADLMKLMLWLKIPQPVKEQLRQMNPAAVRKVEDEVKAIQEKQRR